MSQTPSLGPSKSDTSIAFFYCKHKDTSRNSFLAVAKGVLSQLINQNKHLIQYFYETSSNCGETSLQTPALAKDLLRIALSSSKRTYVILDGLDECDSKERRHIVQFFRETVEALPSADMDSIRCLFVSQDDKEARNHFKSSNMPIPLISICPSDTKHDIHSFVMIWKAKIVGKFGDLQGVRCDIAKIVTAKAQGIFGVLHSLTLILFSLIILQACFCSLSLLWKIYMNKLRWKILFPSWRTFRQGSIRRMLTFGFPCQA